MISYGVTLVLGACVCVLWMGIGCGMAALAEETKKKWAHAVLIIVSSLMLLPAFWVVIRAVHEVGAWVVSLAS